MPAPSMKSDSIRSCSIDGCLHNVCKDSSKICKSRCSLFLESYENSNPDSIGSYQNGSGITDILNEKFNSNGVTNSVMRYCGEDCGVQDGLFPHQHDPLVISDTLKVEDIRLVTDGALECMPLCHDETVRDDACENAKINDHNTAANHWFLDDSSCFDQFALGVEDFGAINLQMAELDYFLKSNIQGFPAELVFPSAMMEDCLMIPSLEETINAPFDQVKSFCGDFWTSLDNDLQSHDTSSHRSDVRYPAEAVDFGFMDSEEMESVDPMSFIKSFLNLSGFEVNTSNHRSDVRYPAEAVDFGFMDSEEMESVDPMSFIKSFLNLSGFEVNLLPVLLPRETSRKRVTLVLDLDETLIHSTTKPCAVADFSFKIPINMEEKTVYVRRRPFLKVFLERVSEMFEIILFTASQRTYAELLLDRLDPEGKFFSRSAFRDSCVFADGIFTKDLMVLGVDLAKVAIVDNTPQVYRWQVSNGIPIKSWYDDPSDSELMNLLPFLETLVNVDDVRPIITQKFGGMGQH